MKAEERFLAATALDSKNPHSWNGLGWSRIHQQRHKEAYEAFQRCLEIEANHGGALNGAGQTQLAQRNYAKAEEYFSRAGKDAPVALVGLARVQLLQKKFKPARKTLDKLSQQEGIDQLDGKFLSAMYQAAKARKLPDDLRKRLEPMELPKSGEAQEALKLNARGWQMFNTGKARPAELAFRQAIDLKPDFIAAKNGLGFSLLNQNKPAEAKPIFRELVKLDKEYPGFVNGLARCYAALGEPQKAVDTWRSVDSKDGQVNACTWGIARTLTKMSKHEEALPYWERIAKSVPNDSTVKKMLKACQEKAQADKS